MNHKLVLFSGIVTMAIGMGLGAILATLLPTPFKGEIYRDQKPGFMVIGATGGFLFGASMEVIRELKEQQDQDTKNGK